MCESTLVHCGVLSLPLAAGCAGLSENAGLAWLAQRTKKEPPQEGALFVVCLSFTV